MVAKESTLEGTSKTEMHAKRAHPIGALFGMIVRPRKTLQALDRGARTWWWVPLVLTVIVIAATTYTYAFAFAQVMYHQQVDLYEQTSAQDRGFMPEPEFRMTPAVSLLIRGGGKVLWTAVTWLAWAGTLTLAAGLFDAPTLSFGRGLAWFAWSCVPLVVRGLVQSVYMAVTRTPIYNSGLSGLIIDQAPAPMVMGPQRRMPAIPTQGEVALASVLGSVDLFMVWNLLLLVAALVVCAQWRRSRAILTVIGIALLMAALGAGLAMLGGSFGRLRLF
jgi:hypothetical protein